MALPDPLDSAAAHAFRVTLDGVQVPKVMEVSGLKVEVDKFEHKQQTETGQYIVRQLIGRQKPGEFTVTRGLTDSKAATDWLKSVMHGDLTGARKTASVEILDYTGQTLKTYNFSHCWVKSVELSAMKAGAAEQATEKFTVCWDECTVS